MKLNEKGLEVAIEAILLEFELQAIISEGCSYANDSRLDGEFNIEQIAQAAIIAYLPHHESALQNAVVILPDGALPKEGDVIVDVFGKEYAGEYNGEPLGYPIEAIKILVRNGKPVVYESQLVSGIFATLK